MHRLPEMVLAEQTYIKATLLKKSSNTGRTQHDKTAS